MRLIRILLGILLALLVVASGALAYLHFADLNRLRPQIEKAFADATGRELSLDGELQIDLLPTPKLLIERVSLANAAWARTPGNMLEVGHFSVAIDLWSILSGPLIIEDMVLEDASLLLETGPDGARNWLFAQDRADAAEPAPKPASQETSLPAMINHARLSNVAVTYRVPSLDDKQVRVDSLTIAPGLDDNLALQGRGQLLQQPLALDGSVGPLDELAALGAVAFNLKGRLGPLQVRLGGQTSRLAPLSGASLAALVSTDELRNLLEAASIDLPLRGPLQIEADVSQLERGAALKLQAHFAQVDATADARLRSGTMDLEASISALEKLGEALGVAGLPPGELTLNGTLAQQNGDLGLQDVTAKLGETVAVLNGTLAGAGTSTLEIEADGPRLSDLQASLPPLPWKLKAQTEAAPRHIVLEPFDLRFGDSDLSGKLDITRLDKGSAIDLKLRSRLLDLTSFGGSVEEQPAGAADAAGEQSPNPAAAKGEFVFKDVPLPFGALKHNEVDADVFIRQFRIRQTRLNNVKVAGSLHGQLLKGDASLSSVKGGTAQSQLQLDTAGDVATLLFKLDAQQLQLNLTSGKDTPLDDVPAVGITVDIASRGNTPRALAASTDGRVLLTQGPGTIDNKMLTRISGDVLAQLFAALNPFAKQEQYSNWDCSIVGFDVIDGVADLSAFLLQGEKIMALAGGGVDLNTEKLNIEFNTKPRKGVGITADMFVTPFIALRGTLAHPRIGLNQKGAILTTGAAVATGGISLLVTGFLERATAEGDQCAKTMARFSQGTTPKP